MVPTFDLLSRQAMEGIHLQNFICGDMPDPWCSRHKFSRLSLYSYLIGLKVAQVVYNPLSLISLLEK